MLEDIKKEQLKLVPRTNQIKHAAKYRNQMFRAFSRSEIKQIYKKARGKKARNDKAKTIDEQLNLLFKDSIEEAWVAITACKTLEAAKELFASPSESSSQASAASGEVEDFLNDNSGDDTVEFTDASTTDASTSVGNGKSDIGGNTELLAKKRKLMPMNYFLQFQVLGRISKDIKRDSYSIMSTLLNIKINETMKLLINGVEASNWNEEAVFAFLQNAMIDEENSGQLFCTKAHLFVKVRNNSQHGVYKPFNLVTWPWIKKTRFQDKKGDRTTILVEIAIGSCDHEGACSTKGSFQPEPCAEVDPSRAGKRVGHNKKMLGRHASSNAVQAKEFLKTLVLNKDPKNWYYAAFNGNDIDVLAPIFFQTEYVQKRLTDFENCEHTNIESLPMIDFKSFQDRRGSDPRHSSLPYRGKYEKEAQEGRIQYYDPRNDPSRSETGSDFVKAAAIFASVFKPTAAGSQTESPAAGTALKLKLLKEAIKTKQDAITFQIGLRDYAEPGKIRRLCKELETLNKKLDDLTEKNLQ